MRSDWKCGLVYTIVNLMNFKSILQNSVIENLYESFWSFFNQLDVEWSPQIRFDLNLETRKML